MRCFSFIPFRLSFFQSFTLTCLCLFFRLTFSLLLFNPSFLSAPLFPYHFLHSFIYFSPCVSFFFPLILITAILSLCLSSRFYFISLQLVLLFSFYPIFLALFLSVSISFLLFNPRLLSVHLFFRSVSIVLSLFLCFFSHFIFVILPFSSPSHTFFPYFSFFLSSSLFYFSHFLSVSRLFLSVSLTMYLFYFPPSLICFRSSLFRF